MHNKKFVALMLVLLLIIPTTNIKAMQSGVTLVPYQAMENYTEYETKVSQIYTTYDVSEWIDKNKELQSEYNITEGGSLYESFDADTLKLLFKIVEIEAESGAIKEKENVASVIFNRVNDPDFPNTLYDVLTEKTEGGYYQFSSMTSDKFDTIQISQDTALACMSVYQDGDTTGGCLYFDSCSTKIHSKYATYQFTDDIGHKFYTKK